VDCDSRYAIKIQSFQVHPINDDNRQALATEAYRRASEIRQRPLFTRTERVDRLLVYNSILLSAEIGDKVHLKACLHKFLQEFPEEPGLHTRMAELESRECNFGSALKHLREEVDLHPDEDDDWKTTLLLATSETAAKWEEVKAALKQYSPVWDVIVRLLQFHWPAFSRMSEQAREEWVTAVSIRGFAKGEGEQALLRKAALSCAIAVEIETRNRVFVPFRKYISSKSNLKEDVSTLSDQVLRGFFSS
jgi:hypothetical protein